MNGIPADRSFARAVFKGAGLLALAAAVTRLFGLVSSPILTKLAGPSAYGMVALVGTITSLATTVAMTGVDLSYARFYFDGGGENREAVERFCWRFSLGTGLAASILAGAGWWWASALLSRPGDFAVVVGAGTFVAVANVMATTRRRVHGAYIRIAAATVAGGGLGVALAMLLAWCWRPDAWAMIVGPLVGSIAAMGILGVPPPSDLLQRSGLSAERRREVLRMGFSSAVSAPMFWLMNSADRWFLGAWAGDAPLGIYSFAAGIAISGILVNSAVTLAWFPEMTREYESSPENATASIGRLWGRLAGLHMVTWLAVTAAGGDLIRLVADPRFHGGTGFVPWLAGGVFFYGVASLANTGLVLRKNLAPTAIWWVAGAAANLAGNALLVRRFGGMGASVAACLGFAVIAAGMTLSAQSRLYLPIPWGRLITAAVVSLVAGAFMHVPWSTSPIRSLLIKFPVGLAVATAMMRIVAPDWLGRLLRGDVFPRGGGEARID